MPSLLFDVDPTPWAAWVAILTPAFIVLGVLFRYERRLSRRLDAQDAKSDAIATTLEKQFGGNSGGIREAVNGLTRGQEAITERLDRHLEDHARH